MDMELFAIAQVCKSMKIKLNSIKYIEVSICKKPHRYDNKFSTLNESQEYFMEGRRHQCAACAYELGYNAGNNLDEEINLGDLLNSLDESQAQAQRHKSPHAAYAKGYLDGVINSYN